MERFHRSRDWFYKTPILACTLLWFYCPFRTVIRVWSCWAKLYRLKMAQDLVKRHPIQIYVVLCTCEIRSAQRILFQIAQHLVWSAPIQIHVFSCIRSARCTKCEFDVKSFFTRCRSFRTNKFVERDIEETSLWTRWMQQWLFAASLMMIEGAHYRTLFNLITVLPWKCNFTKLSPPASDSCCKTDLHYAFYLSPRTNTTVI